MHSQRITRHLPINEWFNEYYGNIIAIFRILGASTPPILYHRRMATGTLLVNNNNDITWNQLAISIANTPAISRRALNQEYYKVNHSSMIIKYSFLACIVSISVLCPSRHPGVRKILNGGRCISRRSLPMKLHAVLLFLVALPAETFAWMGRQQKKRFIKNWRDLFFILVRPIGKIGKTVRRGWRS